MWSLVASSAQDLHKFLHCSVPIESDTKQPLCQVRDDKSVIVVETGTSVYSDTFL